MGISVNDIKRYWINQPSTLQPHHKLHGVKIIGVKINENKTRIFFLKGDVISMEVRTSILAAY